MTVVYEDEWVTLHHADFRDHLDGLRADAVITDPPYGETSLGWDVWPTGWVDDVASISDVLWCFGSFKMFRDHMAEFEPWKHPTTDDATPRTVRRKTRPTHTGHIEASAYRSEDGGPRLMRSVQYVRSEHGRAIHPTQKPAGIVAPLIEYSVAPGGLIVDPFAGSATTAYVARQMGRRCVAFEAREDYALKAAARLSQQTFVFEETA